MTLEPTDWTVLAMLQRRRADAESLGGHAEFAIEEIDAAIAALSAPQGPDDDAEWLRDQARIYSKKRRYRMADRLGAIADRLQPPETDYSGIVKEGEG